MQGQNAKQMLELMRARGVDEEHIIADEPLRHRPRQLATWLR